MTTVFEIMSTAPAQVQIDPSVPSPQPTGSRPSRQYFIVVAVVVVAASIVIGLMQWNSHKQIQRTEASKMRTALVKQSDLVRSIRISGTVEATQFYIIAAPTLSGQQFGTMTVTKMVRPGSIVKKGDLLVEFDRQNQIQNALDKEAEYKDLVEQIKKKQAEQAAARAKDDTELKAADNAARSAELDVLRNEVVSRIDAEKNLATLEEDRSNLKQLRVTYELKRQAARADLKMLEIQRDRAYQDMLHSQQNSAKMALRSPIDGVVVLNSIWKNGQMGEVQEGDDVRSGVPFMQVMDPASMQIRVHVNQADVGYLHPGQRAQIYLDAYPSVLLHGTLQTLSGIGTISTQSTSVRTYNALFSIEDSDSKLMPDLTAAVEVETDRKPNALIIPRDAVQVEGSRSFVYLKDGSDWKKQSVETGAMNAYELAVTSGLRSGAIVQRNPEVAVRQQP